MADRRASLAALIDAYPTCEWCKEIICDDLVPVVVVGDDRQPRMGALHRCCRVRTLVGGMHHLLQRCRCYGGTLPPDPDGASRYQAAVVACGLWDTMHE